jgi:dihydrofolate reductase
VYHPGVAGGITTRRFDMRKVASGLFMTLDGVVESPEKWQFDYFDEDMMAIMSTHLQDEDAVLMGRVTYQLWEPYWPASNDEPYASHINSIPKYVVSSTLDRVDWNNSTLINGNLAGEIAKLKQGPGKIIGVAGSPTLVYSLLQNDLLDELTLLVHPVVVGHGKRLFKEGGDIKKLKLVDSKITRSGVAVLTYHRDGAKIG